MAYSTINLYKENKNKESFVIIYFKHETTLRHRTSVTVKPKDFDKKSGNIKPTDPDYQSKNNIIRIAFELVEEIIEDFFKQNKIKPTGDYIKNQIKGGRQSTKIKLDTDLTECYQRFLLEQKEHFKSPDLQESSGKDYNSTYNALLDYKEIQKFIPIEAINNTKWLEQFNKFLSKDRPKIEGYKFKTSKQKDKTRHKRFVCLKVFGNWLVQNNYLSTYENLHRFRIKVLTTSKYALSIDEIKKLQTHKFKKENHQKVVDLFIFACHTGFRISDVTLIKKSMIEIKNDCKILFMHNKKTKEKVEIPLSKKALEILEKYDYNLKLYADAKINEYLHDALAELDIFKVPYLYGINNEEEKKYDLITFHTGRRTFITTLVNNNVNLNAIMKMSGHRKLSTLQQYINPDYKLAEENIKILNEI